MLVKRQGKQAGIQVGFRPVFILDGRGNQPGIEVPDRGTSSLKYSMDGKIEE